MYLWFFIVDTIICYKYTYNFKTFCLRQYWDWHISWFHTDNDFMAKIGGHHGFWSPFWYVKVFVTSITVFVILRNIYLEINCVYLWWLDVEIQKFLFLFFRHFLRDNHFGNAPEEGVNPQIFIWTFQILIILALSIQKNICPFIWIWWVWMTGLPIVSGLCLNSLFSRIFTRGNFSPYRPRCRYSAVNFLQNPHNRHPIARPWGRGMGCLLLF